MNPIETHIPLIRPEARQPARTAALSTALSAGLLLLAACDGSGSAPAAVESTPTALASALPPRFPPRGQPMPTMTIRILNNSATDNIYPVLSVGQGGTDTWLQAFYQTPSERLGTDKYPRSRTYRIYIAPSGSGIPAGGAVTIRLPLASTLVAVVDPTKDNQVVDWWQGGGIRIYKNAATEAGPPSALVDAMNNRPDQQRLLFGSGATSPTCATDAGTKCQLVFVSDSSELPLGDPYQLMEYTLGAVDTTAVPYKLNTKNIDVDVSYVDSAFMPALVQPYPNTAGIWGWVGVNMTTQAFDDALTRFLNDFPGWPQFVNGQGQTVRKIPSPLNIFTGDEINTDQLNAPNARGDLTPLPWAPIEALRSAIQTCQQGGACPPQLKTINTLFDANYQNYKARFGDSSTGWDCTQLAQPADDGFNQRLGRLYGWSPYTAGCTSASANQLYNTPGYFSPGPPPDTSAYEAVKRQFDELQLDPAFNPYVLFIHGEKYLNSPNVYAYSVDDAVGNLQVDQQTGFYLAVGSPARLPNPDPAGPMVQAPFGYAPTDTVRFVKYGVCTLTPDTPINPNFTSFVLPGSARIKNCPVSFIDNNGRLYRYQATALPPYALFPAQQSGVVDCSGNDANGLLWCNAIFAQAKIDNATGRTVNFLIAGAPPQP
jgi:hypothetical protein